MRIRSFWRSVCRAALTLCRLTPSQSARSACEILIFRTSPPGRCSPYKLESVSNRRATRASMRHGRSRPPGAHATGDCEKPAAFQSPSQPGIALAKFTHNRPRHAQHNRIRAACNQIIDMPQTIQNTDDAHHIAGLQKADEMTVAIRVDDACLQRALHNEAQGIEGLAAQGPAPAPLPSLQTLASCDQAVQRWRHDNPDETKGFPSGFACRLLYIECDWFLSLI